MPERERLLKKRAVKIPSQNENFIDLDRRKACCEIILMCKKARKVTTTSIYFPSKLGKQMPSFYAKMKHLYIHLST
jgi:hypothetical protein